MPLAAGTRLGAYDIVAPIGAGGMGEVYRARDTRLNRDVALKVLPELVAADSDRLARFEREAQAIAALSHPNILAIHDYGVDGTRAYAVMELVEGQTLRERLAEGTIPTRKAIEYAVQIARGLAAAHEKAIVHRDLKPENIIVAHDGLVKILDFGLARQAPAALGGATAATMPQDTAPGTVLGTVGYMSPEQVRGEPVDARSDLFSFGSVLYEMLTGRRAFQRDTTAETMTAILREDPPAFAAGRLDLPPSLDRIVRHCLEKNRRERFQTARDVAFALDALSGSATAAMPAAGATRGRWLRVAAALAVAGALLVAGVMIGRRTAVATAPEIPRFERKTFGPQAIFNARFAPDGETIVYSAAVEGNVPELFVSRPGTEAPQRVGVRGTHLLSISSKGELAVLADATFVIHRLFEGTLARMPLDGAPRPWMDHVRSADWSPDGATLAIVRVAGFKDQLEYPIGTKLYETTGYLSDVRVSPDGRRVAFMDHQTRFDNRGWVKVVESDGKVRTIAGEFWGEEGLAWTGDGRSLLFSAQEFDADGYQTHVAAASGEPAPHVAMPSVGTVFLFDVSGETWLLDRTDEQLGVRALVPGTAEEREFGWLEASGLPLLSRDARTLVFTDESRTAGANYGVMLRRSDTQDAPAVRLGVGRPFGISPDGSRVLVGLFTPMQMREYPTGVGEPITLNLGPLKTVHGAHFLPDGTHVLACGEEQAGGVRCYLLDAAGGAPTPFMREGLSQPAVSPDGLTILGTAPDGSWRRFSPRDQQLVPANGLGRTDEVAGWSSDSRAVFVVRTADVPSKLQRVDLASGQRTFVRELAPPERAGCLRLTGVTVVLDGAAYAYGYWKRFSKMFVVKHRPS